MHMTLLDKDIREPLFDWLEQRYGRIRILEEKQIGRSRADVVAVTEDGLIGIEIKSDADSYARLSRQVKDYNKFYDFNTIVAGTRHAAHVHEHVPEWWGILSAELINGLIDFYVVRKPQNNPKVQGEKKITILWRPELNRLLGQNALPAYKRKSKLFVQKKLLEKVPGDVLWPMAMEELFERDYNTIGEEIESYRREEHGIW
jgi:hypothetical protein